jgi:hypothetical protein
VEFFELLPPLLLDVAEHPKELSHFPVKELVVIIDYALQVFHPLPHCFHGLKALIDGHEKIRYGVAACRTTHGVLSKKVIIAVITSRRWDHHCHWDLLRTGASEDRWMVAPWCDEFLTTWCGLTLG